MKVLRNYQNSLTIGYSVQFYEVIRLAVYILVAPRVTEIFHLSENRLLECLIGLKVAFLCHSIT